MEEICVIGFPSRVGGADTELDHQIRVWQALGIRVHLIHTGELDEGLRAMRMCRIPPDGRMMGRKALELLYSLMCAVIASIIGVVVLLGTEFIINHETWLPMPWTEFVIVAVSCWTAIACYRRMMRPAQVKEEVQQPPPA